MSDLIAFLNARLDEDEAVAKAASNGPWSIAKAKTAECDELAIVSASGSHIVGSGYEGGGVWYPPNADHIARQDPARALREVAAKRERLPHLVVDGHVLDHCDRCMVLRQLASVWSDHPDYDPAWAPEAASPPAP